MDLLLLLPFISLQSQSFIGFSIHQTHESASASGIIPGGGITSFFFFSQQDSTKSFAFIFFIFIPLGSSQHRLGVCSHACTGLFCLEIKLCTVCFWFFVLLCFHANHSIFHALSLFSLTFATMFLVPHAE